MYVKRRGGGPRVKILIRSECFEYVHYFRNLGGGGAGKALTMTMTTWNLTHGQWSKKLTMATDILESAPWSMVKMVILWTNLVVRSTVCYFDHRKFVFRSWP